MKKVLSVLVGLALLGLETASSYGMSYQDQVEVLKNKFTDAESAKDCNAENICHLRIRNLQIWDKDLIALKGSEILSDLIGSKVNVVKVKVTKFHLDIWYYVTSSREELNVDPMDIEENNEDAETSPDLTSQSEKKRVKRFHVTRHAPHCYSRNYFGYYEYIGDWECYIIGWVVLIYAGLSVIVFFIGIIIIKIMYQPQIGVVHGRPDGEQPTLKSFPHYRWWYLP